MTDDAGSGECRCRFEIFPNSPIFSLQIVVDQLPPCVINFAGSLWRSRSLPKGDDDGHHFDDHSSISFWGLEWMHGGWRWTVDGGFQVAAGCGGGGLQSGRIIFHVARWVARSLGVAR
jgi:hypothetical protein